MKFADSSVWIDFLNAKDTVETRMLRTWIDTDEVGIFDIVALEILQGVRSESDANLIEERFRRLPVVAVGGMDVAIRAARYYRHLRGIGIPVRKTVDTLIATCCIMRQHELLFSDRDFDPFVLHFGLRSALSDDQRAN